MASSKRAARAEYWQSMFDRFDASGLSVNEFCSRYQISTQSFYQWRRKLRPKRSITNSSTTPPELLPVRIIPSRTTTRRSDSDAADRNHVQIVTPSGFLIRVSATLPAAQLAELLSAIESRYEGGDA